MSLGGSVGRWHGADSQAALHRMIHKQREEVAKLQDQKALISRALALEEAKLSRLLHQAQKHGIKTDESGP